MTGCLMAGGAERQKCSQRTCSCSWVCASHGGNQVCNKLAQYWRTPHVSRPFPRTSCFHCTPTFLPRRVSVCLPLFPFSPPPPPPSSARCNARLRGRGDLRRRDFCRRQHPRAQRRRPPPRPLQRLRARLHPLDALGTDRRAGVVGYGPCQGVIGLVTLRPGSRNDRCCWA